MTPLLCGFHEGWQCWPTGRKSKYLARNPTLSRVYYLTTVEWSGFLPGSSLCTLALKQQQTMTFLLLAVVLWQLHELQWNSCLAQLHPGGRGWTNSPPLFKNWDDAGQPPSPTWSHLGHLLAGIAMSSWRSTERYEDFIFWKRSVWLCFLGVFLCCVGLGCVCVWVCFASTLEDTWLFDFHLFSNNVRIDDRRQDVLMTVRASSVHGMTKKNGVPSQWPVIGWVVRRGLRPAHCVAWCVYVGRQQFAQGGRLWFSPHTEEVWCSKHVGQYPPTMAIITAASGNQGAWLVPACRKRRAALYQQVQSAWRWYERWTSYWQWSYCVAHLKYFTEPAMAATSASSTLRVSWWTRNAYQHVCPGSRGRTSHIAAVHL